MITARADFINVHHFEPAQLTSVTERHLFVLANDDRPAVMGAIRYAQPLRIVAWTLNVALRMPNPRDQISRPTLKIDEDKQTGVLTASWDDPQGGGITTQADS